MACSVRFWAAAGQQPFAGQRPCAACSNPCPVRTSAPCGLWLGRPANDGGGDGLARECDQRKGHIGPRHGRREVGTGCSVG
jgi:hypothetical protein